MAPHRVHVHSRSAFEERLGAAAARFSAEGRRLSQGLYTWIW